MTCEQAEDFLLAYLDGECSADQREAVADHVASCQSCQKKLDEYRETGLLLTAHGAPAGFKERLFKRLEGENLVPAAGGDGRVVSLSSRRPAVFKGSRMLGLAVSMAAVFVVGLLVGELFRPGEELGQGLGFLAGSPGPAKTIATAPTFKRPLPVVVSVDIEEPIHLQKTARLSLRVRSEEVIKSVIVTVMPPGGTTIHSQGLEYGAGEALHVSLDLDPHNPQTLEFDITGNNVGESYGGVEVQQGGNGIQTSFRIVVVQ